MKRILLGLVFVIGLTISAISQTTSENYIAFRTEIYSWKNDKWIFDQENKNVMIPVYFVPRFIHVEAKQHGYFLLSRDEPVTISEKTFSGFSYSAYDLRMEKNVTIHVIDMQLSRNESVPMLSIVYMEDGINVRYYLRAVRK